MKTSKINEDQARHLAVLDKVLSFCGKYPRAELARRVNAQGKNCSSKHVHNWERREMRIARDYVLAVAAAVDFQVRPHEIAPDLYPHPDDGCPVEIRNLTNVSMANKAIALPTETKCGASSSCGAMRSITNNS